jgi:tRNA G18 (ribose-2'-O)-methylase SpoU
MLKLNAKQLRKTPPQGRQLANIKRNPIYLVLDKIIDTYNVGSLFRLADATAVTKMYLCGDMEYPPSAKIHKAGVGTDEWVPWEKRATTLEVVKELKSKGVQIVVVEQDPKSIAYSLLPNASRFPIAVVVGNETDGVCKEVLNKADIIVELPMFGVNKSFNVWGSAAVVVYKLLEGRVNRLLKS